MRILNREVTSARNTGVNPNITPSKALKDGSISWGNNSLYSSLCEWTASDSYESQRKVVNNLNMSNGGSGIQIRLGRMNLQLGINGDNYFVVGASTQDVIKNFSQILQNAPAGLSKTALKNFLLKYIEKQASANINFGGGISLSRSYVLETLKNKGSIPVELLKPATVKNTDQFVMAAQPPMSMNLKNGKLIIEGREMSLNQAMANPKYAEMLTMPNSTFFNALQALEKRGTAIEFMNPQEIRGCTNTKEVLTKLKALYDRIMLSGFGFRTPEQTNSVGKALEKFMASQTKVQGTRITVFGKAVMMPSGSFPANQMGALRQNLLIVMSSMVKAPNGMGVGGFGFITRSFYESMANDTPGKLQPPIIKDGEYTQDFQNQSTDKKPLALALAFLGGQLNLVSRGEGQGALTLLRASLTGSRDELPGAINDKQLVTESRSVHTMETTRADVERRLAASPKPANWDRINRDFMTALNSKGLPPKTHLMYLYALLIVKENMLGTRGNTTTFQNNKVIDLIDRGKIFTHEEAVNISHLANAVFGTRAAQGMVDEPGSVAARLGNATNSHYFKFLADIYDPRAKAANHYLYGQALTDGVNVNDIRSFRSILGHHQSTPATLSATDRLNARLNLANYNRTEIAANTDNYQEAIHIYRSVMGGGVDQIMANGFEKLPASIKNPIISEYREKINSLQTQVNQAIAQEQFDTANRLSEELFKLQDEMDNKLQAASYLLYERQMTSSLEKTTTSQKISTAISRYRPGLDGAIQTFFQSKITGQTSFRQLAFIYANMKNEPQKQAQLLQELFAGNDAAKQSFIKFVAYNQLREMTDITNEYTTVSDANVKKAKEFLIELGITVIGGLVAELVTGGAATPLLVARVASLARLVRSGIVTARQARLLISSGKLLTQTAAFWTTTNLINEARSASSGKQSRSDWSAKGFVHTLGTFAIFGGAGKLSANLEKSLTQSWPKLMQNPVLKTMTRQTARITPEFAAMVSMEYASNLAARDGIVTDADKLKILEDAMIHSAQFMGGMRIAHLPRGMAERMHRTSNKMAAEMKANGKVSPETSKEYQQIQTDLKSPTTQERSNVIPLKRSVTQSESVVVDGTLALKKQAVETNTARKPSGPEPTKPTEQVAKTSQGTAPERLTPKEKLEKAVSDPGFQKVLNEFMAQNHIRPERAQEVINTAYENLRSNAGKSVEILTPEALVTNLKTRLVGSYENLVARTNLATGNVSTNGVKLASETFVKDTQRFLEQNNMLGELKKNIPGSEKMSNQEVVQTFLDSIEPSARQNMEGQLKSELQQPGSSAIKRNFENWMNERVSQRAEANRKNLATEKLRQEVSAQGQARLTEMPNGELRSQPGLVKPSEYGKPNPAIKQLIENYRAQTGIQGEVPIRVNADGSVSLPSAGKVFKIADGLITGDVQANMNRIHAFLKPQTKDGPLSRLSDLHVDVLKGMGLTPESAKVIDTYLRDHPGVEILSYRTATTVIKNAENYNGHIEPRGNERASDADRASRGLSEYRISAETGSVYRHAELSRTSLGRTSGMNVANRSSLTGAEKVDTMVDALAKNHSDLFSVTMDKGKPIYHIKDVKKARAALEEMGLGEDMPLVLKQSKENFVSMTAEGNIVARKPSTASRPVETVKVKFEEKEFSWAPTKASADKVPVSGKLTAIKVKIDVPLPNGMKAADVWMAKPQTLKDINTLARNIDGLINGTHYLQKDPYGIYHIVPKGPGMPRGRSELYSTETARVELNTLKGQLKNLAESLGLQVDSSAFMEIPPFDQ